MRILIAGATGALGRRVIPLLKSHTIVGLSRSDANDAALKTLGAEPARADLFDAAAVAKAAEGCDVVMHLATKIPPGLTAKRAAWADNDRIRVEGTKNLLAAAKKAKLYVQQGILLAYGTRKKLVREDTPLAEKPHRVLRSAVEMEQLVARSGLPALVLRCGLFYAADDPRSLDIARRVQRRRLPYIGDGDSLTSYVHTDDAAAAFAAGVEAGKPGIYHVADDRPVATKEFLQWLSTELRVKDPWDLPQWFAWLVLGPGLFNLVTMSLAADNTKIKEDLGWKPKYPTFREGWKEVAKAVSRGDQPPSGGEQSPLRGRA